MGEMMGVAQNNYMLKFASKTTSALQLSDWYLTIISVYSISSSSLAGAGVEGH